MSRQAWRRLARSWMWEAQENFTTCFLSTGYIHRSKEEATRHGAAHIFFVSAIHKIDWDSLRFIEAQKAGLKFQCPSCWDPEWNLRWCVFFLGQPVLSKVFRLMKIYQSIIEISTIILTMVVYQLLISTIDLSISVWWILIISTINYGNLRSIKHALLPSPETFLLHLRKLSNLKPD